jgi:peptide/nickel transport system substrate-binding protein
VTISKEGFLLHVPSLIKLILVILGFLLSACSPASAPSQTQTPTIPPTSPGDANGLSTATPEPTPSATPQPLTLTICLGQEPASLFWYANSSSAARSVLAAIIDEPFDHQNLNNSSQQSLILEKWPTLPDGNVRLEPRAVQPGERVLDAQGNPAVLAQGVSYRPAGCAGADCALVSDGASAVEMDELVLQFRLKPGLVWSDGSPLTADDSVYSYEVARALQPEARQALLQVTQSYLAPDGQTLIWRGIPGYAGGSNVEKFFTPLPRHAWGALSMDELPQAAAQAPLGWGAYELESWQAGVQIVLHKNVNYARATEGLPAFDRLVFLIQPQPEAALQALRDGTCDVVDPSAVVESQLLTVLELQAADVLQVIVQPASAWEQLTLGVAAYDAAVVGVFSQTAVRQAAAACIDRQALTAQVLGGLAQPAYGFLPPGHPQALASQSADPAAAAQLLTAAGWLDLDNDPSTPRTSQGVAGFADGSPLAVRYLVSPEPDRQAAAQVVQAGLQSCGFAVELVTQPFEDYLAAGPGGPVFGRFFDLAQFAWPAGGEALCSLYLTSQVPGPYPQYPLGWGGGNASGYTNPVYDQACQAALNSLADTEAHQQALAQAQALLLQDVPVIPLYWRFELLLARSEMCDLGQPANWVDPMWNIEAFQRGEVCIGG